MTGAEVADLAARWTEGLEEADLPIGSGRFVDDLKVETGAPDRDGNVPVALEALTLSD